MKFRGFELISSLDNINELGKQAIMPTRKTKMSAGYDISVIHPQVFELLKQGKTLLEAWKEVSNWW